MPAGSQWEAERSYTRSNPGLVLRTERLVQTQRRCCTFNRTEAEQFGRLLRNTLRARHPFARAGAHCSHVATCFSDAETGSPPPHRRLSLLSILMSCHSPVPTPALYTRRLDSFPFLGHRNQTSPHQPGGRMASQLQHLPASVTTLSRPRASTCRTRHRLQRTHSPRHCAPQRHHPEAVVTSPNRYRGLRRDHPHSRLSHLLLPQPVLCSLSRKASSFKASATLALYGTCRREHRWQRGAAVVTPHLASTPRLQHLYLCGVPAYSLSIGDRSAAAPPPHQPPPAG